MILNSILVYDLVAERFFAHQVLRPNFLSALFNKQYTREESTRSYKIT